MTVLGLSPSLGQVGYTPSECKAAIPSMCGILGPTNRLDSKEKEVSLSVGKICFFYQGK